MTFKEFLAQKNETMTSTADVAHFQRIAIPMVTRQYPPEDPFFQYGCEDPFFKKLRDRKKLSLTLVK